MTTVVRIAGAVALLFPAGLVMGMAFPLGMKLAAGRARELTRVAVGSQRRGVGHGLGAERLHRPDLVDLDRVLGRLALLRRGVRCVHAGLRAQGSRLRQNLRPCALRFSLSPEPEP